MAPLRRLVGFLIHVPVLLVGFAVYLVTGRTPLPAAVSLRRLYCLTDGRLNDAWGRALARRHPPYDLGDVDGVLGELTDAGLDAAVRGLSTNGFHVFDVKLDRATVDAIVEHARRVPAALTPQPPNGPAIARYDGAPLAPAYWFDEADLFRSPAVRHVALD